MKRYVVIFAMLLPSFLLANSGYFGDCAGFVQLSGTFYDIGACSGSGHAAFDGTNLGVLSVLTIDYAEQQSWENSGDDVNSGHFNYRIWTGSPSGPFITESLNTVDLLGGGNEKRSQSLSINVMNGLSVNTAYTIEVYFHADYNYSGGSGTHYLNNGGSNYSISFTTAAVLPVKFVNFEATERSNGINIKWATALEIQNDYFELESSVDNLNWKSIGKVNGAGFSTIKITYEFIDKEAFTGLNYYRLKQYDLDGNINYSGIIHARKGESKKELKVFPNPFREKIYIVNDNSDNYEIRSLSGILFSSGSLTKQNAVIETTDLPKGVYQILILSQNTIVNSSRIVKL